VRIDSALGRAASSVAGTALAATFGTVSRLRPTAKPLHPRGVQRQGTLRRVGSARPWGVPWLDEPGDDPVLVRFSRAIGLPTALPDILGLTIRLELADGPADLLLATTGGGVLSRFVLLPRSRLTAGFGSLMAYRTPVGPAWLFARCRPADDPRHIALYVGDRGGGRWPFADIDLDADGPGGLHSFDPVLHPLPGLELYPWEQRLREGAYRAARSGRRASGGGQDSAVPVDAGAEVAEWNSWSGPSRTRSRAPGGSRRS
jgi:hypothetical protein